MKWRNGSWKEAGLLVLFYAGFALFYMIALRNSFTDAYPSSSYSYRILYVDYPLKALITLPIWWLTFRVLRKWSLGAKLALNLLLLPAWVKGWQWGYYWLCDEYFGGGHLTGSSEWWDVYIPALFYVLQFGIFHAWHYYGDLLNTEMARAESERLALESELNALKAQLNPHFLYNAFNTISASTGPGQERTRDMIAQLSDLFRYQLIANRNSVLPLGQELDFVTDYLDLEQARFGDRLRYSIELDDPMLRNTAVPPLLLQPLVENAVRHGISPLVSGGKVMISAVSRDGGLQLSVSDDGRGFDPDSAVYGYGISNTRRRLKLLFDQELIIESSTGGGGTRCTFFIPLNYAPQSNSDRRRSAVPRLAPGIPG